MSKINERRERTAKADIENKAALADAPATKSEFPYKKILIAVLAVVAVIACALLILNAVVENYAAKFNTGKTIEQATVDTSKIADNETFYKNPQAAFDKYSFLAPAVNKAYENYTKQSLNVKSNANVYNFVITVNDNDIYADINPNNKLASIVLVSINNEKVTFVRMSAGTLVAIPGLSVGPLYDAYRFGGTALLAKAVQDNYGITVNGYIDLTLDAFMTAALEICGDAGIPMAGSADGEINYYSTADSLFNYIKTSDDKEAKVQEVVKAIASGLANKKVFELRGVVKAISNVENGMVASISRDDFGKLISMGTSMLSSDSFKVENNVITFGLGNDSTYVDYNGVDGFRYYFTSSLKDYSASVKALQDALYGTEAK